MFLKYTNGCIVFYALNRILESSYQSWGMIIIIIRNIRKRNLL